MYFLAWTSLLNQAFKLEFKWEVGNKDFLVSVFSHECACRPPSFTLPYKQWGTFPLRGFLQDVFSWRSIGTHQGFGCLLQYAFVPLSHRCICSCVVCPVYSLCISREFPSFFLASPIRFPFMLTYVSPKPPDGLPPKFPWHFSVGFLHESFRLCIFSQCMSH